jgi:hypothetical protein
MAPGATFTKTWRLKNVGACAWSTSYQLVFFSGEQMGAASSAAFPKSVAVGQTVDISINMTAPSAPVPIAVQMFKNANGAPSASVPGEQALMGGYPFQVPVRWTDRLLRRAAGRHSRRNTARL